MYQAKIFGVCKQFFCPIFLSHYAENRRRDTFPWLKKLCALKKKTILFDNFSLTEPKSFIDLPFNVSQKLSLPIKAFYEKKSWSTTKKRVHHFEARKPSDKKKRKKTVTVIVRPFSFQKAPTKNFVISGHIIMSTDWVAVHYSLVKSLLKTFLIAVRFCQDRVWP